MPPCTPPRTKLYDKLTLLTREALFYISPYTRLTFTSRDQILRSLFGLSSYATIKNWIYGTSPIPQKHLDTLIEYLVNRLAYENDLLNRLRAARLNLARPPNHFTRKSLPPPR